MSFRVHSKGVKLWWLWTFDCGVWTRFMDQQRKRYETALGLVCKVNVWLLAIFIENFYFLFHRRVLYTCMCILALFICLNIIHFSLPWSSLIVTFIFTSRLFYNLLYTCVDSKNMFLFKKCSFHIILIISSDHLLSICCDTILQVLPLVESMFIISECV